MLVGWVDKGNPTNKAIKLGFLQIKPIATHIRKIYHLMYGRAISDDAKVFTEFIRDKV